MSDRFDLSAIEEIENVWIPMADGCRIAARIWLPREARRESVPAILEYIPYRKRDFMRSRDEPIHRYFAMSGYAAIRADIRGSGDSDGILHDEYSPEEHEDALAVIAWIAAQSWCSGAVGMMGISWGGFNALQVAARRPPALKAIITLCSTDDRYADDAHYKGGCLLNENMQWGSILTLYNALPPDPHIVEERWRDMWKARIDALEPFPALWMRHPWRDDYWKHGSICEDHGAIECPVYAIGGWADGYSNAVPRLIEHLTCPKKALIGPWAHVFPHDGVPGPAIGFLQEAVRWWDRWLKGIDNGVMEEPVLRIWMQESVPPQPQYEYRPGRWVVEAGWPGAEVVPLKLHLNHGFMGDRPDEPAEVSFSSPQTLGVRSGEWCAFGAHGEMPRDQRPDDGGSLVFDSDPLDARIELLGGPVVALELSADRPVALVAVRLCDVDPSGRSSRISYGVLNLTHRDSHEAPAPLVPGEWYRVAIKLDDVAQAVPAGHRLRLGLSTAYWPMVWPSPTPVTLTVRTGTGTLDLPVRHPRQEDEAPAEFGEPVSAPGTRHKKIRHMSMRRTIEIDLATNEMIYTLRGDGGELGGASLTRIEEIDLDLGYTMHRRYRILEDDPVSAQTEFAQTAILRRGDWSVRIECRTRLTATADHFQFTGDLEAFEGDSPFTHRSWTISIPRQLV